MVWHQAESRGRDAVLLGEASVKRDEVNAILDAIKDDASALASEVNMLWDSFPVNPVFHSLCDQRTSGKVERFFGKRQVGEGVF